MRETLFTSPLKIRPNLVVRNYRKQRVLPAIERAWATGRGHPTPLRSHRPPNQARFPLPRSDAPACPASGPGAAATAAPLSPNATADPPVPGKGSLPQPHGERGSSTAPAAASAPPGSAQHSPRTASHQHRDGRTCAAAAAAPAFLPSANHELRQRKIWCEDAGRGGDTQLSVSGSWMWDSTDNFPPISGAEAAVMVTESDLRIQNMNEPTNKNPLPAISVSSPRHAAWKDTPFQSRALQKG